MTATTYSCICSSCIIIKTAKDSRFVANGIVSRTTYYSRCCSSGFIVYATDNDSSLASRFNGVIDTTDSDGILAQCAIITCYRLSTCRTAFFNAPAKNQRSTICIVLQIYIISSIIIVTQVAVQADGVRFIIFIGGNLDAKTCIVYADLIRQSLQLTDRSNIRGAGTVGDIGNATLKVCITYGDVRIIFICRCSI